MIASTRLAILDCAGDTLIEVAGIPHGHEPAFFDLVCAEVAAVLHVSLDTATRSLSYDLRDSVALPMPECFELAPAALRKFASEVGQRIARDCLTSPGERQAVPVVADDAGSEWPAWSW